MKIALIEDNLEFMNNINEMVSKSPDIKVAAKFTNGRSAIKGLQECSPDIILTDLGLPDMDGVDVITAMREKLPNCEFLVLSNFADDDHVFSALKAGAVGYITKGDVDSLNIVETILATSQGCSLMSKEIAEKVLQERVGKSKKEKFTDILTKRELGVLEFAAKGYSAKKIARVLDISFETVRTHLKNIYKKLHVCSVAEVIAIYSKD